MKKEELLELAEKHQAKADTDFQNYQETGMSRYGNSYRRNEDMADAFRMAAAAADDHAAYVSMKADVANFVWRAKSIETAESEEKKDALIQALIRDLVAYGRMQGLIRRD